MLRTKLLTTTCGVFLGLSVANAALITPAHAKADGGTSVTFNIPAQDLGTALSTFGQQAKVAILFDPAIVRGKHSRSVSGAQPAEQALKQILPDSTLTFQQTSSGAMVIKKALVARTTPASAVRLLNAAPQTASAAAPPAESDGLDEIVVTAEKKSESLQRTPISIVALGQAEIENMRINDVTDIGNAIPNVQQQSHPSSANTPLITIRGIGAMDDQITQDPSVAVYVDGVYVARSQGMGSQIADLERVEVLRGPQGTLYGRNATGGAINFVTRQPQLGEWGLDATLGLGNRDEFSGKVAVNAPIGDTLAARFAYMRMSKDGFVKNLGTGERRFGSKDREAIRADLRWQPFDTVNLRYVFEEAHIGDTPFYIQYVPDPKVRHRPSTSTPQVRDLQANDITTRGHSLTADWQISDDIKVRSISAYRKLDSHIYQDYLSGRFGPGPALASKSDLKHQQWSQEFQILGSAFADQFDYILGAYYFHEVAEGHSDARQPITNSISRTIGEIENTAYALYAQGTYTPPILDERLHLTAAARWSRDKRDAHLITSTEVISSGLVIPRGSGRGHRKYTNVSPSFTVAFDATPTVNLYAKYSEGYKAGGYNVRSSSFGVFARGFEPEYVTAYELGVKSEFFDRRVRLNVALFRSNYDDIQMTLVNVSNPTTSDTINAGKAVIQGAEVDLTAKVAKGLTLALGGALLDPDYKSIIDGGGNNVTDNFRFSVPKQTFNAQLTYKLPPTPIGDVSANIGYNWQSRYLNTNKLAGFYEFPAYGILNSRIVLSKIPVVGEGDVSVALWAKNLTDTKYWFINGALFGGYRAWGEPRSYGIDLNYKF